MARKMSQTDPVLAARLARPEAPTVTPPAKPPEPAQTASEEPEPEEKPVVPTSKGGGKLQVFRVVKRVEILYNGATCVFPAGREVSLLSHGQRVLDILRAKGAELELLE